MPGVRGWTCCWTDANVYNLTPKTSASDCKRLLRCPRRSHEWLQMSRADREKMGLVVRDVGEFWYDFSCCHRVCLVPVLMALPFPQDGLPGFLSVFHRRGGVSPRGEVPPVAQLSLAGGAPLWGVGLSSIIQRSSEGERPGGPA